MTNEPKTPATDSYPHGHAFPSSEKLDRVARLVTELGAGWARYGLTLGRLALQQSARALETTSEILGEVATKIEKVATAPKVDAPAAEPTKN